MHPEIASPYDVHFCLEAMNLLFFLSTKHNLPTIALKLGLISLQLSGLIPVVSVRSEPVRSSLVSVGQSRLRSGLASKPIGSEFWGDRFSLAPKNPLAATCQTSLQTSPQKPKFLVFAGGGAPSYNEIALEKNVLYFQRTLKVLGFSPEMASIFFANGNDGRATIRYIDPQGQQKFKVPQIPNLQGASTPDNLRRSLQQMGKQNPASNLFFYFTGHGIPNRRDMDNNAMMLWRDQPFTVRQFSTLLDQMPRQTSVVTMMAQCFSGSFANLIYEGGNPDRPVALQTRCGFFATIKTRPSVGCTPAVNEADYRDYSSSFFAALGGRSRTGESVASADYNQDKRVSYKEAHAFAKVDEDTTDLPISTSESWLQEKASTQVKKAIWGQPIATVAATAYPDQRYVIDALTKKFSFDPQVSFTENFQALEKGQVETEEKEAYLTRLVMELLNVGMEKRLRTAGNPKTIAILNQVQKCENSSWNKP